MIPKRIITTWICDPGRDRYQERHREMFAHCMTSWLKWMPDYEVLLVTLGNLRMFGSDPWLEARIADGNFIGCSQWARVKFLQVLGGVFLDADVEAVQRFDELLDTPFTLGHIGAGQGWANNAVMACAMEHPFLAEQMRALQKVPVNHTDYGNATGPALVSQLLYQRGWDGRDREAVVDGITVRSSKVFHPYPWYESRAAGPEAIAIHHWASSWKPLAEQPQQVWR